MPKQSVLSPGLVKGFMSAQSQFTLPEGIMAGLQNVRLDDNIVRLRPGGAIISEFTAGLGNPRGLFTCIMDGVPYMFVAGVVGSKITIFVSVDGGLSLNSVTPNTGPYGDQRMTDRGYPVSFEVVNDMAPLGEASHDCLIIQSGDDRPRVFAQANVNSPTTAVGTQIMAPIPVVPTVGSQYPSQLLTRGFLRSVTFSSCTYSSSTADFKALYSGYPVIFIQESPGSTTGSTATITFGSSFNATGATQILIGMTLATTGLGTGAIYPQPQDFMISLTDGTTTQVVWGAGAPVSTFYVDQGVGTTEPIFQYITFAVNVQDLTINSAAITAMITTLESTHNTGGAFVVASYTYFGAGGQVQNGSNVKVALYATDARSVGPSMAFSSITDQFASYNPLFNPPAQLDDPRLYVTFYINLGSGAFPSTTVNYLGYDAVNVYVELYGQSGYYLVEQEAVATYSSGSGFWSYNNLETGLSNVAAQDFNHSDPQASAMTMPIGTYIRNGNGRLCVCSGSTFWYSEFSNAFLFYQSPVTDPVTSQVDPLSGGSRSFGGEQTQAIIPMGAVASATQTGGAPVTGSTVLYVLTDQNLYQIGGYDSISMAQAASISSHGTLSPWSIARNENRFYWLDNQFQVRVCQWGYVRCLSLEVVDNLLLQIPSTRLGWAAGTCLANRYYLSYSIPSTGVNSNILVWSELRTAWESVDVPHYYTCETLTTWLDVANDALRLLGSDVFLSYLRVVEHARPGNASDPASNGVVLSFTPPTLRKDLSMNIAVKACGVVADSASAGGFTIATSRLGLNQVNLPAIQQQDSNPVTGTIPVVTAGYTNAYDQEGLGIADMAVQVNLSGTLPGGFGIYSAWFDVDDMSSSQTARA